MLAKIHRFHGLGSLRPVYRQGKTVRSGEISLRYQLNQRRATYRAAIVISKKVHKSAVKRNRVRRRIYEIIRLNEPKIVQPYDLIVSVFSDQIIDLSSNELTKRITKLLADAGIINR